MRRAFFDDPDVLAGDMISKTNETKIKPKKNEMNKLANVYFYVSDPPYFLWLFGFIALGWISSERTMYS